MSTGGTHCEAPPSPPLTINGAPEDIVLTVGETANFATNPDAIIALYETADCSGTSTPSTTNTAARTLEAPGITSAQAMLIAAPEITSNCLMVTWNEASAVPDDSTATSTSAEPPPAPPEAPQETIPAPTVQIPQNQNVGTVTGLPSTGSGTEAGLPMVLLAAMMTIAMTGASIWRRGSN